MQRFGEPPRCLIYLWLVIPLTCSNQCANTERVQSLTYLGATGDRGGLLNPFPMKIRGSFTGEGRVYHGEGNTLFHDLSQGNFGSNWTLKKGDTISLLEDLPDGQTVTSKSIRVEQVRTQWCCK